MFSLISIAVFSINCTLVASLPHCLLASTVLLLKDFHFNSVTLSALSRVGLENLSETCFFLSICSGFLSAALLDSFDSPTFVCSV